MEEELTPFTCDAEDLYFLCDDHYQNCLDFVLSCNEHNITQSLYWPNRSAAPWHLQMQLNGRLINFWPHKMKAHVADESRSVEGIQEVFATIRRVERDTLEDFDLLEDDE